MLPEGMVESYGNCVSVLHVIPVKGKPDVQHPAYVLEIDINPKYTLTNGIVFSYIDSEHNEVAYIKADGNVMAATDLQNKSLQELVKVNSERRLQDDLQRTKSALEHGLESADDETASSLKIAIAKIDQETRSQLISPDAVEQVLKMRVVVSAALRAADVPAAGVIMALAGIEDKFTENIVQLRRQIKEMDRYRILE